MVGDQRSDAALWLEASSGTEASFGVVYDRYRARVFRRAYAQVSNVADAEDIVAIVFLEAWRRRRSVRFVDGSLLPWLLLVTTNVTLNTQRSARRHRRLLAALPPAEHVGDPAHEVGERVDGERMSSVIGHALGRLTAAERRVVDLCLIDELPLATAATVLDVPLGSVKSRLSRARRKLQVELDDHRPASVARAPEAAGPAPDVVDAAAGVAGSAPRDTSLPTVDAEVTG